MFHKVQNFQPGVKAVVSPTLDPRLLDLLRRHRDLCRARLELTREIQNVERQIWIAENITRCAAPGVAVSAN